MLSGKEQVMKDVFENARIDIVAFSSEDVITSSTPELSFDDSEI